MTRRRLSVEDENLGRMIRVRRLQLGMTQGALARRLGVTFQAVAHWEVAERRLSAGDLLRIARVTRTPVEWFYGSSAKMGALPEGRGLLDDYAAAAEALFLAPEIEAVPRLEPAQLAAVRSLIASIAPPLAEHK